MIHVGAAAETLGVMIINTRDPSTVPVNVPWLEVVPYIPEIDAPAREIVNQIAQASA